MSIFSGSVIIAYSDSEGGHATRTTVQEIDWCELKRDFDRLHFVLGPYTVPSETQLELHKLSKLTYGQINSPPTDLIDSGYVLFSNDEETIRTVGEIMQLLGFSRAADIEPGSEAQNLTVANIRPETPFDTVRHGIDRRTINAGFVKAFGTLEYCWGTLRTLFMRDQQAKSDFDRKLSGMMQGTIVQEHWFAHWMNVNAPSFAKDARHDACVAMLTLCEGIATGKLAPSQPYPREWFEKMLEIDRETGKRTGDLKSTYTRMPVSKMKTLLQDPIISAEVLPPLRASDFRPISREPLA